MDRSEGGDGLIGCIAVLLIVAGLMMIFGFWPIALIIAGVALFLWWGSRNY